ncbi:MAG TPA: S1C family serine protease [Steroidobacteraceae bacterium]|nr:S1C family serine protease [Steroidobacteraceae bacterium]
MSETTGWSIPAQLQPQPGSVSFDLEAAFRSIVQLHAAVPEDAFTASVLGTERMGNGVVIRADGLVLTIGYLITEAETIWLTTHEGTAVAAHPLAYDQATGFGLVLPLGRLSLPVVPLGSSAAAATGSDVIVLSHGGLKHALQTKLVAKREFAGYWEYLLEEALFTSPAHPHWSGAALLGMDGKLLGIGSLFVQEPVDAESEQANMFVPVDLIAPVLDEFANSGRPARPPRPWLGMYATELQGHLFVGGLTDGGPAARAGVRVRDMILEVADKRVATLAELYRSVWSLGPVGTEIPLTLVRRGTHVSVKVRSADRNDFLRKPLRH